MNRLTSEQASFRSQLNSILELIEAELAEVEGILRAELRSDYPFVDELVRYGCLLGGKRLRPSLVLLAGRALDEITPEHLTVAAAIEMVHTATLVHDDVLDGAEKRRHLATVNSRWDTEASILLGDFLFTHAFYLASTLDSSYACQRLGRATNLVCEGELRQKGTRGDFDLDEATYLSIIEAKTAELCAGSSALGAYFAGAVPAVVTKFDGYGRCLGIAFQIADDVLDIVGDERVVGKSLGTDLDSQKPTLPLIRLLSVVGGAQRERLIATLEGEPESRREVLLPYFQRYGAVEYAREVAIRYAEKARRYLEGLEPNPAVDALHQVAEYAVTRPA